jgi:hypothetical protein
MTTRTALLLLAAAALLGGCASQPAELPSVDAQAGGDTAQRLEKKFQEAARDYRLVQRDGRTLYCKHEKVIGSTIPITQCLTEAQLRLQVENMDELRDRLRTTNKCALLRTGGGGRGCVSGGG